jgi:hypothetical protein
MDLRRDAAARHQAAPAKDKALRFATGFWQWGSWICLHAATLTGMSQYPYATQAALPVDDSR